VSPAKKRRAAAGIQDQLKVSERRVCRVLEQSRSTQRRTPIKRTDENALREQITALACAYGRYGYRRITGLLRNDGWQVNHKRVARIWRQEGLKVPQRQPKRRRLWLNDGSCIRLRPERRNHGCSSSGVYRSICDRTMVRSSSRIRSEHGCSASGPKRWSSSRAVRGRTDTSNRSMGS
jgi:hypothetical protein